MSETCYMCEKLATGKEHVPPQSLFPEEDAYRKNLIRVPSCEDHNTRKSKDDEYLRAILSLTPGVNAIGLRILETKVMAGLERSPHHVDTFYEQLTPLITPGGETASFTIIRERFDEAVSRIVRGLFFHDNGRKLLDPLYVICSAFVDKEFQVTPFHAILVHGERTLTSPWFGANPEIFSYSFQFARDNPENFICRMRFFEGCLIYAGSRKNWG